MENTPTAAFVNKVESNLNNAAGKVAERLVKTKIPPQYERARTVRVGNISR